MPLLRQVLGETLRSRRLGQERTLREVSGQARVSLGYLSEVERGQKEASSELLSSICAALGVELAEILDEVSLMLRLADLTDVAVADGSPDGPGTGGQHSASLVSAAA
ncbi:MAG: helix-turn-helix domain-containing protein [Geodermatophilaceae bacterium]